MARHRPALLGEAGHVEHRRGPALDMSGHGEQRADRHHAGAADAGDQDRIVAGEVELARRLGQREVGEHRLALLRRGAVHRDEARAEALDAGEVLVAARLVDGALPSELGLDRHDGDAVRLHPAVAAALADELVDDDPLVRIGVAAALPPPALLGRAGLVVDEHRETAGLGELLLHRREDRRAGGRSCRTATACRRDSSRGSSDRTTIARGALRRHLPRDPRHVEAAVHRLAAGHRHGVVEEDLVGDVDAGRRRRADGEAAGVVVGAVAEILEDVPARRERRLADPVGTLAAHLGVALGGAVHVLRHVVAADAGIGARAFGHDGRGIVRAARAEIGGALGDASARVRASPAPP